MSTSLPRFRSLLALVSLGCVFLAGLGRLSAAMEGAYVFTYFTGNGADGLHLAVSTDGYRWQALNGGRTVLVPQVGESKLMRDPCVVRGPDGMYHMVWTTAWEGKTIGYASSKDLVHWSEQRALPVMAHEPTVRNCWAPEIVYDEANAEYLIFWSSTIPGRFPDSDGQSESGYNHRIYATTTKDFQSFTPTRLFYDPGFSVIDATFLHAKDGWHLIVKDERVSPPKKHLRMAKAESLRGPFGELAAPFTRDWVEGPTAIPLHGDYLVYYDTYREKIYGAVKTTDFVNWTAVTDTLSFPKGARHGTIIEVPTAFAVKLALALPAASAVRRFDFGNGPVADGYTGVSAEQAYDPVRGYGFAGPAPIENGARTGADALRSDFCTSAQPFLFSVDLPEGNYRVTVTLGDVGGASSTTVKSESRRLHLDRVTTAAGQTVTRSFLVNTRTPALAKGGTVKLKPREIPYYHWDDKLTLEFAGERPCVAAVEIAPASDAVTVFLAGDSTVTDQDREPWAAWGQMLPRFFGERVAVANYAESGEAARAFLGERRLDKILEVMKPGDYLFVQFGHNDEKEKGEGVGPFTTYKTALRAYVERARARGGIPVLVTSMYRRNFDASGLLVDTHGDYPVAVRQLAEELAVPLIDLHAMSKQVFEALGADASVRAFVHYPANTFPGQTDALADNTHFSNYGAYQMARCMVEGIKTRLPALAGLLAADAGTYDPAKPDDLATWRFDASAPRGALVVPEGR